MYITLFRLTAVLLFMVLPVSSLSASPDPCDGYPAALMVDTSLRTMWVCLDGQARREYRVALGRGGTGKQSKGDKKTPLGCYDIGSPRSSSQYRLFIPIGYPNDEQKAQGFSGGAVGIHGPHREMLWLGHDSTEAGWTLGCIAVGTDEEILEVGRWIQDQNITKVVIQ